MRSLKLRLIANLKWFLIMMTIALGIAAAVAFHFQLFVYGDLSRVNIGDTSEMVIRKIGKPTSITAASPNQKLGFCQYEYFVWLHPIGRAVQFQDDKVVEKGEMTSP